jgi:hypothetical protein
MESGLWPVSSDTAAKFISVSVKGRGTTKRSRHSLHLADKAPNRPGRLLGQSPADADASNTLSLGFPNGPNNPIFGWIQLSKDRREVYLLVREFFKLRDLRTI